MLDTELLAMIGSVFGFPLVMITTIVECDRKSYILFTIMQEGNAIHTS